MEIPKIERYVSDLLTVSGFTEEGSEHHLWVLLHHLYSAVAMYEQLSDDDKAIVAETQKKLKYFFETKISLRTRKSKKQEKEGFPPHPQSNEKEKIKEKEKRKHPHAKRDFSVPLEIRREAFRQECLSFLGEFDTKQLTDFFYYWAEENQKTGKMKFERETSWKTQYRLKRWVGNEVASAKKVADLRVKKTEKKEVQEKAASEQQESIAAERQLAQQKLEQQQEESKQGAVSYEEWLSMRKNKKD